ncbi:MAG: hypothetical protein DI589_18710 [Shinella sp.]|nr:MAG: hypothetical protein DI589_18710 [Shinella sp.]
MQKKKNSFSLLVMFIPFMGFSQFVNEGDLYITKKGVVSVFFDAINKTAGDLINDGNIYYHKNLYNNGLISFTANLGGNTYFVGLENQVIQTDLVSEYYNVFFDNNSAQPAFHLDGDISIENRSYFNSGIINSSPFGGTVIFKKNADYANASDASFVDGKVAKIGYDSFNFPIGDSSYLRGMEIHSDSDQYSRAQYYLENSSLIHPHTSKDNDISIIDNAEYWNIDLATGQNLILTLSWREETTPSEIRNTIDGTAIQIVGWNTILGKWVRKYGTADNGTNQITAIIDSPGIYTLARVRVKESFPSDIIIYNGMSPNNDGQNDIFYIDGIQKYPQNNIEIYNRWGALVYKADAYGISGKWFNGISQGDITINKGEKLPTGTYFYILKLKATHGNTVDTTGYLYIN